VQTSGRGEADDEKGDGMRSVEDLSLAEMTKYAILAKDMHESALLHGLVILAEGTEHTCKPFDELPDDFPHFNDIQMRAFFAYEAAMLENFKIIREGLEVAGLPVETGGTR